jgi:hypothetical protein
MLARLSVLMAFEAARTKRSAFEVLKLELDIITKLLSGVMIHERVVFSDVLRRNTTSLFLHLTIPLHYTLRLLFPLAQFSSVWRYPEFLHPGLGGSFRESWRARMKVSATTFCRWRRRAVSLLPSSRILCYNF